MSLHIYYKYIHTSCTQTQLANNLKWAKTLRKNARMGSVENYNNNNEFLFITDLF